MNIVYVVNIGFQAVFIEKDGTLMNEIQFRAAFESVAHEAE